ncbi:dipeptidase [Clostridium estertheticum]|uniref:dipeptidase n=1 Tax=Clostridium estertheticum TaxID=238834 RepID=UPI0013E93D54|nr:dipeptidase [Clostridium estertheticum]MBZ9686877.1 dipeptidase [Clostridium estertheticum]
MMLIDLHCDTILKCMEDEERFGIAVNEFSVDINKLKQANSLAQFFALFVDLKEFEDPFAYCMKMANKFFRELEKNKEQIAIAKNYKAMIDNNEQGKLSAFLAIEEGGVLKGEIDNLKRFYQLGIRLITLTWNYPNEIGFPSSKAQYNLQGLTSFGKEVVKEMNSLGMIIDVSHLSDKGFYDVAKLSSKPFVASHSNARSITSHCRNLSDEMIKILADKGGIMGINFEKSFLGTEPLSRVEEMVTHISHIKNVGGIDVIAIGTDFDGISDGLQIENIGQINKLILGLQRNHFSEAEIEKILYKNAIRVIKDTL